MGSRVTALGHEKKEGKKELKKHAATIHCSNTLTLLQRKITNALLFHAYKDLLVREEHIITVKQLCRLIGYHGNNHAVIKDALRELISTIIEWNVVNDETGQENWTASSIIASVSLQGPLCYYGYSPRMKQLLHSPSMFGKIDLVIQSNFRSSYGLALYENCIRYRGLPFTKWFEMELFKKLMGVPAGKYDVFRDFKRRVLDKAIDEVNTYSDLLIEPEFIKEGRKVAKFRFKLKERPKRTRLGTPKPAGAGEGESLRELLGNTFGLSDVQIQQLTKEYTPDFIMEKIKVVQSSKPYQAGKIDNISGYLLSAIKNDYQAPKSKAAAKREQKPAVDVAFLVKVVEGMSQEYAKYRDQTISAAIEALPPAIMMAFNEAFEEYAEPVITTILQLQGKRYKRNNVLDSPQVRAFRRQFAVRELDIPDLKSFEQFVLLQDPQKVEIWQQLKTLEPNHPALKFNETR